jgi:hypothetical protein
MSLRFIPGDLLSVQIYSEANGLKNGMPNAVPMLLILKPKTLPVQLRTQAIVDLQEQNKNTHYMTSPLPDMGGMSRASSKPFCSTLDLRSVYEQIRIVLEHVKQSIKVITSDGNIVSQVIQIGDCELWLALLLTIHQPLLTGHCAQYWWFFYNAIVINCQTYCE